MAETSTQKFLEINDIKEGVLLLKNKELRGIMMVSSINFALKSDEEQTAIIYGFQNFLNTLDFPCQILARSRRINITPYLDELRELERKQINDLLRKQTESYRVFIAKLVEGQTIMTKNFYIVIPFTLAEAFGVTASVKEKFSPGRIIGMLKGEKEKKKVVGSLTDEQFQRCRSQLWQRMEFVAMGLRRCGLEAVPLTTPEIIELFWAVHHPKQAEIGYYPEILPELLK